MFEGDLVERMHELVRAGRAAEPLGSWNTTCFTCLDLFCGAGGLSEGFRQAGFDTIAANDFDVWAGRTYELNHGRYGTKFVLGDIAEPAVKEELLSHVQGIAIDVVVGGPPCQAFSQVRNHERIIDDPRIVSIAILCRCLALCGRACS